LPRLAAAIDRARPDVLLHGSSWAVNRLHDFAKRLRAQALPDEASLVWRKALLLARPDDPLDSTIRGELATTFAQSKASHAAVARIADLLSPSRSPALFALSPAPAAGASAPNLLLIKTVARLAGLAKLRQRAEEAARENPAAAESLLLIRAIERDPAVLPEL